jgi:hypothetical protein
MDAPHALSKLEHPFQGLVIRPLHFHAISNLLVMRLVFQHLIQTRQSLLPRWRRMAKPHAHFYGGTNIVYAGVKQ